MSTKNDKRPQRLQRGVYGIPVQWRRQTGRYFRRNRQHYEATYGEDVPKDTRACWALLTFLRRREGDDLVRIAELAR